MHSSLGRSVRLLAALLVVVCRPAWAGPDFERWYSVTMMGQRAGWMMSSQKTAGGTITTASKMNFAIRRGQAEISLSFESEFVETLDHRPVSMRSIKHLGAFPVETRSTFDEKGIMVETTQNGEGKTVSLEPLPAGAWLTPGAAGDFALARLKAGDPKVVVRTIDPQVGASAINVTHEVLGAETVRLLGRDIPVTKCRVTQDVMDAPSTEYVDENGIPARVEVNIGAIALVMEATTRADATAGGAAPEIMISTFVKPDRRIPRPRYKKTATYTLSVPEGQPMTDLPQAGAQRVERVDDRTTRVTVDILNPLPAPPEDRNSPVYLESSQMIGTTDPQVAAMMAEATRGAGDKPAARAEAIRRYVHGAITTKNLDVGFATASEVARTRVGDCTEHAVLLAAVLRAGAIPARVVSGLVYTEGFAGQEDVFGYHMWAQALLEVDGQFRWVDLDATLGDVTFDATHIALSVTALSDDDALQALAPMASLLGRLSIKVDSAE